MKKHRPGDYQRRKVMEAETVLFRMSKEETGSSILGLIHQIWEERSIVFGGNRKKFLTGVYPKAAVADQPDVVPSGRNIRQAERVDAIFLPPTQRQTYQVLHELAHVVAGLNFGPSNIATHGKQFASVYLKLVRSFMGPEAFHSLRAAFSAYGVRYRYVLKKKSVTWPRKTGHLYPMTPERAKELNDMRWGTMRARRAVNKVDPVTSD